MAQRSELPGVRDDGGETGVLGFPAEVGVGGVAAGDEGGGVAGTAGGDGGRDGVAGDGAAGVDDLADRETRAAAEVVDAVRARGGGVEGQHVGVREVGDVDVVADAGAVLGGPV